MGGLMTISVTRLSFELLSIGPFVRKVRDTAGKEVDTVFQF